MKIKGTAKKPDWASKSLATQILADLVLELDWCPKQCLRAMYRKAIKHPDGQMVLFLMKQASLIPEYIKEENEYRERIMVMINHGVYPTSTYKLAWFEQFVINLPWEQRYTAPFNYLQNFNLYNNWTESFFKQDGWSKPSRASNNKWRHKEFVLNVILERAYQEYLMAQKYVRTNTRIKLACCLLYLSICSWLFA
jgi:hypothetical protein